MSLRENADPSLQQTQLDRVHAHIVQRAHSLDTLPTTSTEVRIEHALASLPQELPEQGLGLEATTSLLLDQVSPALAAGQAGPRYFGLVVGGVLPAAQVADHLVTSYDPCVQIHNPSETISTSLEAQTLTFLLDLLSLPKDQFTSNTFTTGATASNLLGLSLARDDVIGKIQARRGELGGDGGPWRVNEDGTGGVEVEVLVAGAHASVAKVASLLGIGRRAVVDMSQGPSRCDFNLDELKARLKANQEAGRGSVVALAYGEVNTGGFTTQTRQVRALCDEYDAWLHIDAAFGAFAVLLPNWQHLAEEMASADSITSDAHKWLNVPYDCGLFFSRPRPASATSLFALAGPGAKSAAYLSSTPAAAPNTTASTTPHLDPFRTLPSPLFVNIENSRRFRALPVYAGLVSLGRRSYADLFTANVDFARRVAAWMRRDGRLEVLTPEEGEGGFHLLNVVLFAPGSKAPARFQGASGAAVLREEVNGTKKMHITGTVWDGRGANRLAVSNWATTWERDGKIVLDVLGEVLAREG